jgi:hypothetical protein
VVVDAEDTEWAMRVPIERTLADWRTLASSVGDYPGGIDDYTNDLTVRDAPALILSQTEPDHPVLAEVEEIDSVFRRNTADDEGVAVGRYFRRPSEPNAGWWWKRRPISGSLGSYLDHP